MGIFYAFLMLEDKDLKFASRSLENGVGVLALLVVVHQL